MHTNFLVKMPFLLISMASHMNSVESYAARPGDGVR